MRIVAKIWIVGGLILSHNHLLAQEERDTTGGIFLARQAFLQGLDLISIDPSDTIRGEQSIDRYVPYAGRIVRTIHVERLGFERSIYDTSASVAKLVSTLANALHVGTRERTIRQHLFIRVHAPLNPYRLADNERFLRDQEFILDSRIVVTPVSGTDSVDLTVITRDIFSLGARLRGSFPDAPELSVGDVNVDGRGQRIAVNTVLDQDRTPKFGYSISYYKSSVMGSLANFEIGYTQISGNNSIGEEPEHAAYLRVTRPLVSPYARWAGSLELSRNWSRNIYQEPDSVFSTYRFNLFNVWAGYNFGIYRAMENRDRKFLALRYFDGYYLDRSDRLELRNPIKYKAAIGFLSEFTLYRQNFYKTRFVYGFGRTEDVPSGFSLGVTTGFLRIAELTRPYVSVKYNHGYASTKGNFYRFDAQAGGYLRQSQLEDVILTMGASYFTRLWHLDRYKMRNTVAATYSRIFRQRVTNWLGVNEAEIAGFKTDSLVADQRLAIHGESVLFTPWSLLGFRFAPFGAVDLVPVHCGSCDQSGRQFWGFTVGIRTRNENLIFGTLELKLTYVPEDEYGKDRVIFGFKQNLRIKNSGTFVRAPSLIAYN